MAGDLSRPKIIFATPPLDLSAERLVHWMPDGACWPTSTIATGTSGRSSLTTVRPLTDFKTDQTFFLARSHDGRLPALTCGGQASDVVTITDFK